MKIVKIILILILIIFVVAVIGGIVFLKSFDLNQHRPRIIQQISSAVGRPIEIRNLDMEFSLTSGVLVIIEGFAVPDKDIKKEAPLLKIEEVRLSLDVMAFLKDREVRASSLYLIRPQIILIQDRTEGWSFQDIVEHVQNSSNGKTKSRESAKIEDEDLSLPKFIVQAIKVEDGEFSFLYKDAQTEYPVKISQFSLDVVDFSINNPFSFSSECALMSGQKDVMVRGRAQLDLVRNQVRFDDIVFQLDLDKFENEKIPQQYFDMAHLSKDEPLKGQFKMIMTQAVFSKEDLLLVAEGSLSESRLVLSDLPHPLEELMVKFHLRDTDLTLDDVTARYGQGEIKGSGTFDDLTRSQRYDMKFNVKNINVKDLLTEEQGFDVDGQLELNLKAEGKGFQSEQLKQGLSADGKVEVTNGQIMSFNMLKTVIEKLTPIPGLSPMVLAQLPENYREDWERDVSTFEMAELNFKMQKGSVEFDHLDIQSDDFFLSAEGRVDMNQNLELTTRFFIPQQLSEKLIEDIEELKMLSTEDNRIQIPLKTYQGPLQNYRPMPDLELIGKKVFVTQGKKEINKLLEKVLGRDEDPQEGAVEPVEQGTEKTEQEQPPIEEQLIEGLFDAIFK